MKKEQLEMLAGLIQDYGINYHKEVRRDFDENEDDYTEKQKNYLSLLDAFEKEYADEIEYFQSGDNTGWLADDECYFYEMLCKLIVIYQDCKIYGRFSFEDFNYIIDTPRLEPIFASGVIVNAIRTRHANGNVNNMPPSLKELIDGYWVCMLYHWGDENASPCIPCEHCTECKKGISVSDKWDCYPAVL